MNNISIKRNVVGNLVGRLYAALISFAVVPIYMRLLRPEGYGLVGLFVTLQTVVTLLDFGLSSLMTRELARLSALPDTQQEQRDLARTLELVYWLIGAFIGAAIILFAPLIASHALHAQALPKTAVVQAIRIIGLIMVFQWPDLFYSGGLLGLQRQVALNVIRIVTATLQSVGALLILKFVSQTISAYLAWMVVVWATQTALLVGCLWKTLPRAPHPARFRKALWIKNSRFTKGMTGVALTTVLLSQSDKLAVGTFMPLAAFGYYTFASSFSNTLPLLFSPIYNAVFPRFSQFVALEDEAGLAKFYHKSCQLLALIVLPTASVGAMFSREILTLFMRNAEDVRHVQPIFCLLLIGTAFNGIVTLPYALQLAYGWTSLAAIKNLLATILIVPLLWFTVKHYGAIGGCVMCLTTNIGYFLLEVPIMHRRLLRHEMPAWYLRDVGLPLLISLLIVGVFRVLISPQMPVPILIAGIAVAFLTALACTFLAMPWARATLTERGAFQN